MEKNKKTDFLESCIASFFRFLTENLNTRRLGIIRNKTREDKKLLKYYKNADLKSKSNIIDVEANFMKWYCDLSENLKDSDHDLEILNLMNAIVRIEDYIAELSISPSCNYHIHKHDHAKMYAISNFIETKNIFRTKLKTKKNKYNIALLISLFEFYLSQIHSKSNIDDIIKHLRNDCFPHWYLTEDGNKKSRHYYTKLYNGFSKQIKISDENKNNNLIYQNKNYLNDVIQRHNIMNVDCRDKETKLLFEYFLKNLQTTLKLT